MKKLIATLMAMAMLVCSGTALTGQPTQQTEKQILIESTEVPFNIVGFLVETENGLEEIMIPNKDEEMMMETVILPPVIILPPIYIWQSGLFYYVSVPFYGYVGPGNFLYLMSVDLTGIRHDWVWVGYWFYLGAS